MLKSDLTKKICSRYGSKNILIPLQGTSIARLSPFPRDETTPKLDFPAGVEKPAQVSARTNAAVAAERIFMVSSI